MNLKPLKLILLGLFVLQLLLANKEKESEFITAPGKFAELNGVKIHYKEIGEGKPLLLIHGNQGFMMDWLNNIPELSKYFKLIVVDSRGQGSSTDSDEELSYKLMASDMIQLLKKLSVKKTHIVGYSDGANIALQMARQAPELLDKMVMFGGNYKIDTTVVNARFLNYVEQEAQRAKTKTQRKLWNLLLTYPQLKPDDLKQIKTKALIMAGENDLIKESHTKDMHALLENSELDIVPNADHQYPTADVKGFNKRVLSYLLGNESLLRIQGKLFDNENMQTIPFVNIGFENDYLGTVSSATGEFSLDIPYRLMDDSIHFSMVGYESMKLPVSQLSDKDCKVTLNKKTFEIEGIQIAVKEPKTRKYGVKSHTPLIFAGPEYEFAQLIKAKTETGKIKEVNLYVMAEKGEPIVRLNVYKNEDSEPGASILQKDILFEQPFRKGWNKLDVSKYNLRVKDSFFIAVQTIPKENSGLHFGVNNLRKNKTYVRKGLVGGWESSLFNVAVNTRILYF